MRIPLTRLIARNPFPSVTDLMARVVACCDDVPVLIDALIQGDQATVVTMAKQISTKECACDAAKTALRDALPSGLFMSVDRRDLLQLVSQIDDIADCAEDVGVLLTLRPFTVPPPLVEPLRELLHEVLETVRISAEVVANVDVLLASGFGGAVAKETMALISQLGRQEHEADKRQDRTAKILFQQDVEQGVEQDRRYGQPRRKRG
jgi:predicted phosphate transport protein (TIGR00153 family)